MKPGVHIMLVDDEATIRDAVRHLLEHCGYEVESFDNARTALNRFGEGSFDLVITDFAMPGMQGDQLVDRIRSIRPGQRIIMATAFVEEYNAFGEASTWVNGILLKPFTFRQLQDTIEDVLAQEDDTKSDPLAFPVHPPVRHFIRSPKS